MIRIMTGELAVSLFVYDMKYWLEFLSEYKWNKVFIDFLSFIMHAIDDKNQSKFNTKNYTPLPINQPKAEKPQLTII